MTPDAGLNGEAPELPQQTALPRDPDAPLMEHLRSNFPVAALLAGWVWALVFTGIVTLVLVVAAMGHHLHQP